MQLTILLVEATLAPEGTITEKEIVEMMMTLKENVEGRTNETTNASGSSRVLVPCRKYRIIDSHSVIQMEIKVGLQYV